MLEPPRLSSRWPCTPWPATTAKATHSGLSRSSGPKLDRVCIGGGRRPWRKAGVVGLAASGGWSGGCGEAPKLLPRVRSGGGRGVMWLAGREATADDSSETREDGRKRLELPPSLEPTDTGGGTLAVHSVSTGSGGAIAAIAAAGLNGDGRAGEVMAKNKFEAGGDPGGILDEVCAVSAFACMLRTRSAGQTAAWRAHRRRPTPPEMDLDTVIEVDTMSLKELKQLIAKAGLTLDGCIEKADLRQRAREAQAALVAGAAEAATHTGPVEAGAVEPLC